MKIGRSISTSVAAHAALKTGVHGVGTDYIAKSTNADQLIRDADVAALAAIAYSKLNLTGLIRDADIKSDAAIALSKLASQPWALITIAETEVFSGTSPIAWTDLNLSGTIGSQATLVILKVIIGEGNTYVGVRRNGDTDDMAPDANNINAGAGWLAQDKSGVFVVVTDTSGVIEWKTSMARTATVDVIGYLK